jgi:hypothetical protein
MQELQFRRCCGCGRPSHKVNSLTAIIGDIYLCEECILLCVSIVANQANVELRIHFVEELQKIMKEPIETIEKWKSVRSATPSAKAGE